MRLRLAPSAQPYMRNPVGCPDCLRLTWAPGEEREVPQAVAIALLADFPGLFIVVLEAPAGPVEGEPVALAPESPDLDRKVKSPRRRK